ncbi:MAG: TenA family protein [Bryobacteraceae bacterium]
MLHETLWEASQDLALACLRHPFIVGLGEGTLDPRIFRAYVEQDSFYLRAFLKAYALALARTDDLSAVSEFYELIGGALRELDMHRHYAASIGLELEAAHPNPACLAYTDFLLATAWHRSLGEILAAMTPCMRLYAWLGERLSDKAAETNPYRQWIRTYSSAEFHRLAARIESLLDRLAADTPEIRDAYRYAMECELRFFSSVMPDL